MTQMRMYKLTVTAVVTIAVIAGVYVLRGTAQGTMLVVDPPEVVARKTRSAVTDSGREVRRGEGKQGIENLIEILSVATGESPEAIEVAYEGKGYGDFKGDVADAVVELLRPIRERYLELRADESELNAILERGRERAADVADPTLAEMLDAMGFRVPPRGG